jgi:hypothetical protein
MTNFVAAETHRLPTQRRCASRTHMPGFSTPEAAADVTAFIIPAV